jgi:hypothetical protein
MVPNLSTPTASSHSFVILLTVMKPQKLSPFQELKMYKQGESPVIMAHKQRDKGLLILALMGVILELVQLYQIFHQ